MCKCLQILILVGASGLTATAASAQLQMQEQSVGAPRRGPPSVYRPQSVDGPAPTAAAPAPPPKRPGTVQPVTPAQPRR